MNNYQSIIIDPGHGGIDFGFQIEDRYEKDFNLKISQYIYNKLKELGFPIFITRNGDFTVNNYDRYDIIDNIIEETNGKSLVLSIHVNNEQKDNIEIIYSVNSDIDLDTEFFHVLNDITEVKTKTLPNNVDKDFYAIQRLTSPKSEVIVIEFGFGYLKLSDDEIENYAQQLVDVIINYLGNNNLIKYINYTVKEGDYLYDIAAKFNTTKENLQKINNLGTDYLDIGQIIKVPRIKNDVYIVMKGDSLYSIAKKFNTTVDKIKEINDLVTNKLIVNQKLLIPD